MSGNFQSSSSVQAQLQTGVGMLQAGRLEEAWNAFVWVLERDPANAVALHLIAVVAFQIGQFEFGVQSLKRSIAFNPNDPVAYSNLGNGLRDMGAQDEALTQYNRALAMAPDFPDAWNNRGLLLRAMGRDAEALADYDRALALHGGMLHVHNNRADALRTLGRVDEALASYDKAVALAPGNADVHYNRANLLADIKRLEEAVASFDRALALRPEFPQAWVNRGNALLDLGRGREALASYDQAIAMQSDLAQAHSNRSNALRALNRHAEAVASSDEALAIDPEHAEALTNRGNALLGLNRKDEALISYDKAIAVRADLAQAFSNRGNALRAMGRHAEALESCDRAIAIDPTYADPRLNRAAALSELGLYDEALYQYGKCLALDASSPQALFNAGCARLTLGDFEQGWTQYEARWRVLGVAAFVLDRGFSQPLWLGREPLAGKIILLHSEQGLGDTLQFCRYAPMVKALGATVILEVEPALVDILKTLEGVDRVVEKSTAPPAFDYHCPLLSLPLAFQTRLETIPAAIPYLRADPAKVAAWAAALGPKARPRVGLVWSGGVRLDQPDQWALNERRNVPLARFAGLAAADVEFHGLQKGQPAEGELGTLQAAGWDGPAIVDHAEALKDFTDTAALIENLDLVIAVDTSTAHLAGALGKPVWILNRFDTCWRWMTDRTDSPWYPTVRLFRQKTFGDWGPVLEEVAEALIRRF